MADVFVPADPGIRRGFLLAEEEALKAKLSNLHLRGSDGQPKRVKVWFSRPSSEREAIYPFITIDLLNIVFAADRAHSAQVIPTDGWPSEFETMAEYATAYGIEFDPETQTAKSMMWHPYDIYYQVATHTRNPMHDRALTGMLLSQNYLPLSNFGYLDVPADGTCRWLDNQGFATADYKGPDGKWVHRKAHTIKISAHQAPENPHFYRQVVAVFGQLYGDTNGDELLYTWSNVEEVVAP